MIYTLPATTCEYTGEACAAKSQEWVQIRAPRAEIVDAVEAALTNGATRLILNILD